MRRTSLTMVLLAGVCAWGAEKRPGTLLTFNEGFANGITVSCAMVAEPPDYSLQFSATGNSATNEGKTYHRWVVDDKNQVYYGYDLTVEPVPGTPHIRVLIEPLSLSTKQLNSGASNDHTDYAGLRFLVLPKYPPPQIVDSGDTIALDLLVSPDGKQKAVEYLEITEKPASKN